MTGRRSTSQARCAYPWSGAGRPYRYAQARKYTNRNSSGVTSSLLPAYQPFISHSSALHQVWAPLGVRYFCLNGIRDITFYIRKEYSYENI